ncbi:S8 family serine peptidase [Actinophytocola oryzae]|uniref:Subtilisin family serine protease n=1 Tax=Actinophytocola oryzae TaxID=502181 RepID=A0A4R7V6B4_9PSEU|nr:S8 family serine peptidase [Actinophytocola oryzae]TDV43555.1 subtilisin family serine protease [Actinophytocola oryzae]
MRRQRFALVAAVAVLVLPPAPAVADPPSTGTPPAAASATVTLITGDRVAVRGDRVVSVAMNPRRAAVRYWRETRNGHDYVIPMDAARALAGGRLDERLFDVTGLVRQGYDDRHTGALPVIVAAPEGARSAVPAGARVTTDLGPVDMLGLDVPKATAADFFATAGEARIWLDARVSATLDQSVPMTGAPQAWQAGYQADGVPVAVLDTGIDATHPDVAGRIDAERNFSDDPDTVDHHGHGTHVASTILGSGAASGGRYRGMAPGARLLVGKVLDSRGSGAESGIIAGMQWAADQGARVINMSLGGYPDDGTDPMSVALDEISETSGALFVVAAGNFGEDATVSSPGTAGRALTVASVTKSGELSSFSSRGPRLGDNGMKPEIAGPGSDIVAARAAGTLAAESVNASYAKLSGTSMATPHVAGAAAIVAGQHPDWRAEQLKNALVSSANPIDDVNAFGQGAGLVDVARAVTQPTRVEPAAITMNATTEADLVYVNDGDEPLDLTVSADLRSRDGDPAPDGLFGLSDTLLSVPAKGTATLSLSVTPRPRQSGQFVGTVDATGDGVRLTTPVSATLAGEEHAFTVHLNDRQGNPAVANVTVQNETTGESYSDIVEDGVFAPVVPEGRYRVIGQVLDDGWNMAAVTTFALAGREVGGDTEVTVDTAAAGRVTVSVDDPTARPDISNGGTGVVSTVDGDAGPSAAGVLFGGGPTVPLYALGSPEIDGVEFAHVSQWQRPWTTVTVTGENGYELADALEQSSAGWVGAVTGPLVDVGDGTAPGDLHGKVPLLAIGAPPGDEELARRVRLLKEHGARLVLAYEYVADLSVLPVVQVYDPKAIARLRADLAKGPVEVRVDGRRDSPYSYLNAATVPGGVPDGYAFRFDRADMGRIDGRFASLRQSDYFGRIQVSMTSGELRAGFEVNTRWPQKRTDYVSPGAQWQYATAIGFDPQTYEYSGYEITSVIDMRAGERRALCLYCAPFGPELAEPQPDSQSGAPLPWAYRQGDKLTFEVPMFGSADPGTFTFMDSTNTGTTVLYRDGREVGRNDAPGRGQFDIPRGTGRYTLVSDAAKTGPEWPLSVRTRAEWTFATTPSTERTALPLLDVRYDLPLDGRDSAPAGGVAGHVDVVRQGGGGSSLVRALSVAVSFDDGATWKQARVSREGDRWKVALPGGTGFASLRATATDALDNSVTETVIRAYAVR